MRIRTSPEFYVSKFYGKLIRDPNDEDICHIMNCNQYDTFCFDLEHKKGREIHYKGTIPPLVQIAFQYSITESDRTCQSGFRLRRKMRIYTCQVNFPHLNIHFNNLVFK